jgi:hypothetical protein
VIVTVSLTVSVMYRTTCTSHRPRPVLGLAVGAALVAIGLAVTAPSVSAQYAGGGQGFVVTPLRVPAGGALTGVGFGCPAASTVTITVQGEPGVLTSVVAAGDTTFSFTGVALPPSLLIGGTYSAVASCGGLFLTADFTVICANGAEPDAVGDCPAVPPGASSGPGGSASNPGGAGSGSGPLAFTGASSGELVRWSATLIGVGGLIILIGRRRRERPQGPARAY